MYHSILHGVQVGAGSPWTKSLSNFVMVNWVQTHITKQNKEEEEEEEKKTTQHHHHHHNNNWRQ